MLARTAFALTCVLPLLIASAQSQPSDRDAPMTGSGLEEREERNSPAPLAPSHGPLWTRRDSLPAATGSAPKQGARLGRTASRQPAAVHKRSPSGRQLRIVNQQTGQSMTVRVPGLLSVKPVLTGKANRARADIKLPPEAEAGDQNALAREQGRTERLARDLAAARAEIETVKADRDRALTASAVGSEAADPTATSSISSAAGSEVADPTTTSSISSAVGSEAADPTTTSSLSSAAGSEVADPITTSSISSAEERWLTRANTLLKVGDISGARLVLEHAVEQGSNLAAFKLAETYDPTQLSLWRVRGVQGDWAKAQDLYARARATGITRGKEPDL